MTRLILLTLCLACAGCADPKGEARKGLAEVSNRAKQTESRLTQAQLRLLSIMPTPDAVLDGLVADSITDARAIQESAAKASVAVEGTRNPDPAWLVALGRLWWLAVLAGVAYLIFTFWPVLRPILNLIGLAIPRATRSAAKLDAEAAVAGDLEPTHDKTITVRRATDPAYDKAFRTAKAKATKVATLPP